MKRIIIILSSVAAMFTSCSSSSSLSGEWTVLTIKGEGVSAAVNAPEMTISADMKSYSGITGLNTISGSLSVRGGTISFGDGAMTKMAGDPESMDIEMKYLDAIRSASKATVNESGLTLTDKDGSEVMTLKKK